MQTITIIFSNVVLMACMACVVIPIVLIARALVGKVSKRLCFLLWGIVALRLIFPVMLPSGFSIFGYSETLSRGLDYVRFAYETEIETDSETSDFTAERQKQTSGVLLGKEGTSDVSLTEAGQTGDTAFDGRAADSRTTGETAQSQGLFWYHVVWLLGMAAMLSYAAISCLYIARKLKFATRRENGVYESEAVGSPFVFGVLHPVIYLPYHLREDERSFILRHERYHIKRKDYLTRAFAYLLLSVYWFHPLVWLSYLLFLEDMETSCDEQVLWGCNLQERRAYGKVLLHFAEKRRKEVAGLGFGEGNMKRRMKHILAEKKKSLWATGVALVFVAAIAFVCLTDQIKEPSVADQAGELGVSEAAVALFADANPYIGDASANGRLLGTIHTYFGGLSDEFTTELQTSEEPYVMTLHFAKKPVDEEALWRDAVLFLALTENCGEVRWDYETGEVCTRVEQRTKTNVDGSKVRDILSTEVGGVLETHYVSLADVNVNLGIENVKEYAASPEGVEELLELLERVDGVASTQYTWQFAATDGTNVFMAGKYADEDLKEILTPVRVEIE